MRSLFRFKTPVAILMLLSIFTAVGGHWFALQGVAWVRMAISYSAKADVKVAIQKTFDGKHPCLLCHEIVKHREPVKAETERAQFQVKLDLFIPTTGAFALIADATEAMKYSVGRDLNPRSSTPPTPPPKSASFRG